MSICSTWLGIGLNHRRLERQRRQHRHVVPHQPVEHVRHVGHHFVQIDPPHRHHPPAAEGQQLARQMRGELRRLGDLGQHGLHRIVVRHAPFEHRAVAHDDAEEVVEVVSHPARQPTQGLEPLRVLHPSQDPLALGHLVAELVVGALEVVGAADDPLLELVARRAQLLLDRLAGEEVGDLVLAHPASPAPACPRRTPRASARAAPGGAMTKRQCSSPRALQSTSLATSGRPKLSSHQPDE